MINPLILMLSKIFRIRKNPLSRKADMLTVGIEHLDKSQLDS